MGPKQNGYQTLVEEVYNEKMPLQQVARNRFHVMAAIIETFCVFNLC